MQNPFDATNQARNQVNVNNFDWTFNNNLTMEIGVVTPCFCELVPNKTGIRIQPAAAMQFMPMVFPIQTPLQMRTMFFKYPLRALWTDYRDYVGNFRQGLVEPYLNINTEDKLKRMVGTGSLGDYLNIPSTLVGDYGQAITPTYQYVNVMQSTFEKKFTFPLTEKQFAEYIGTDKASIFVDSEAVDFSNSKILGFSYTMANTPVPAESSVRFTVVLQLSENSQYSFTNIVPSYQYSPMALLFGAPESTPLYNRLLDAIKPTSIEVSYNDEAIEYSFTYVNDGADPIVLRGLELSFGEIQTDGAIGGYITNPSFEAVTMKGKSASYVVQGDGKVVKDITLATSPYYNSLSANKEKQIKLAAYKHRAYIGCYNAYIRDNRNNPYYVNGEVQYNRWIPTYAGGEDNNVYELQRCNWEKDFLTTAVQSPQQGQAPLVGLTTYETVIRNDDGTYTTKEHLAIVDEDGRKFGVDFKSDTEGLQDVQYSELSEGTIMRQPRSLIDVVSSGIAINDLRNVNCYQKYLELNMRAGYSYKQIIEARFDVKVRYDELLMPEFIGGYTVDMNMNAITQTIDRDPSSGSYENALGSQAGIGHFRGNGHPVECFCDEESIVIGLSYVVPMPIYTQLLPKDYLYRDVLDHFTPEFNNIGFQPITYREVCPIQAWNENPDTLMKTFGYNRPWYEFVQKYDQAHGEYRTSMRNFLMNRTFNSRPELSQSFLLCDPAQINEVFSVTDFTDKVYGQMQFRCTAKLPVSRIAIPRLD